MRRSPHGERGLKLGHSQDIHIFAKVALLTESVDWNCKLWFYISNVLSRSPHGERGLKWPAFKCTIWQYSGRSPHGERGLKLMNKGETIMKVRSLSSRRAWIEIRWLDHIPIQAYCRSPHGERGLKSLVKNVLAVPVKCRSPHGERGLKFFCCQFVDKCLRRSPHGEHGLKYKPWHRNVHPFPSLSSRRAGIEIEADTASLDLR